MGDKIGVELHLGATATDGAGFRELIQPTIIQPGRHVAEDPSHVYLGPLGVQKVPRSPGREKHILELLRLLRDFDPDASIAVWNLLRITNSGHEVFVRDRKGIRIMEGEDYVNALARDVWALGGGGADTLVDTLLLSFFTYGGAGVEVEVTDDTRDVADFWPFAPYDIEFDYLPVNGKPKLFMFPARRFASEQLALNPLQVHYLPLDPDIDDPYGRSPLMPALSALLGLTALLTEIMHVTRVHGYGMRDIVLDHEAVISKAPIATQEDPAAIKAWLEDIRVGVETTVKRLKPWDTFVHYNWLNIATTTPGGRAMDLAPVIAEYFRRGGTGLKTPPIMMGRIQGAQTQSTVEWQVYANGLNTMQAKAQRLVEKAYNTALRVRGIPGTCHLEFEAIRDTDRQIQAMAEAAERNNAIEEYMNGLINHKDLANAIKGHTPRGPRPPTHADRFRLQVAQVTGQLATLDPLGTSVVTVPGWTAIDPDNLPEPPGADAGITAEEGATLDLIGQNKARQRPTSSLRLPRRAGKGSTRVAGLVVGDTVYSVQGEDLISAIGMWIANQALSNDPSLTVDDLCGMVVEQFSTELWADAEAQGITPDDGEMHDYVRPVVAQAFEEWHEDPLTNDRD